jgi:hypothetical protein
MSSHCEDSESERNIPDKASVDEHHEEPERIAFDGNQNSPTNEDGFSIIMESEVCQSFSYC